MEFGLSLGSNMGDRLGALSKGVRQIMNLTNPAHIVRAPVYETEPVGVSREYRRLLFLNTIVIVDSSLSARDWLAVIEQIETEMGRKRSEERNAPRPIDIDIIYAGRQSLSGENLVIPHPRWFERRFVVRPLSDLRPELILPGQERSVAEILASLPPEEDVCLYKTEW